MNLIVVAPWKPGKRRFVGNVLQAVYGGSTVATEVYLGEDGVVYFKDPYTVGHESRPMSETMWNVITALNFTPPPPDLTQYEKYFKTAVYAVVKSRSERRAVMREAKDNWIYIQYLLDRFTGRAYFSGYGVFEAALALNNIFNAFITEVAVPVNVLAKPPRFASVPRNVAERLEQLRIEVVQFGNYRRIVLQAGELRFPTNIAIAEAFMPMLVKRLVPSLTLDRPMGTVEERHYNARIAADLIDYNINTRKMGRVPIPVKTESRVPGCNDISLIMGYLAYALFDLRTGVIISGAMGSGKTYKLNELLYLTPPNFQVVVIERGAKEILTPLQDQMLSIRIENESELERALSQALRYGTALTVIVQAEARTALELYYMAVFKLTGHGNATTMHAESPHDAITRIAEAKAPVEGLDGFVIMQLRAEEAGGRLNRFATHLYTVVREEEAEKPIEHPRLKPMGLVLQNPCEVGLPEKARKYADVFSKIINMTPLDARAKALEML